MLDPIALCQYSIPSGAGTSQLLELVKTVTAIAAVPGALLTFVLGYRQKEKERTLAYYHKVVTDFAVPNIFTFFSDQVQSISTAGREAQDGLNSERKTLPRSVTIALSAFSTQLFTLKNSITDRTIVFDEAITGRLDLAFEAIQDDTSGWFNDASLFKRRNVEELTAILRRGQRTVVGLLYRGQFRNG